MRRFLHEYKLSLGASIFVVCIILIILSVLGLPDANQNEGSGPLAFLGGWTIIIIVVASLCAIVSGYVVYRFVYDKARFEELMSTNSQAIFKRNQLEIERLALRLTSKEEKRVLDAMKRYKIR